MTARPIDEKLGTRRDGHPPALAARRPATDTGARDAGSGLSLPALVRAGGIAMMVSGLALGYSYVSHPHVMSPEVIASGGWFVIHLLFAVSLLLGLLGTTALYAASALRGGRLGLAGFVLLFFGMSLVFGLDYYEFLIAPYLAEHYPAVIDDHGAGDAMGPVAIAFPLAGALTVLGYALLGAAWKRARVLPTSIAWALILTALAFGVGLSPLGGLTLARATAALFGAALIAVGWRGWRASADFLPATTGRRTRWTPS